MIPTRRFTYLSDIVRLNVFEKGNKGDHAAIDLITAVTFVAANPIDLLERWIGLRVVRWRWYTVAADIALESWPSIEKREREKQLESSSSNALVALPGSFLLNKTEADRRKGRETNHCSELLDQDTRCTTAAIANTSHAHFTGFQTVTEMNDESSAGHANLGIRNLSR